MTPPHRTRRAGTAAGPPRCVSTGTRTQGRPRSVPRMSYSQPDPAEETTQSEPLEQPDTDREVLEQRDDEQAALEIDPDDVPVDGADPEADSDS